MMLGEQFAFRDFTPPACMQRTDFSQFRQRYEGDIIGKQQSVGVPPSHFFDYGGDRRHVVDYISVIVAYTTALFPLKSETLLRF
jgi:hypothetical protein